MRPIGSLRLALVLVGLAPLAGCTSPSRVEVPNTSEVALNGHRITWTSSTATMGAVRYGRAPGAYRAVAYPDAADRADKLATTRHTVSLLGVSAGDTVYCELLDNTGGATTTVSDEYRFVIGDGGSAGPLLTWTMIDVGFGDSHLLEMPSTGRLVLIDAGERRDWPNVDLFLRTHGVTELDDVIATHIHADHIGGLVGDSRLPDDGVLGTYVVSTFIDSPDRSADREAYDELLEIVSRRGITRAVVETGDTDANDDVLAWDPNVHVEVLNSGGGHAIGGEDEDDWLNNDSIVLRVSFGDVDFILGGDAESPVESRMLASGEIHDSELLKIHHHGVDDASGGVYLDAVDPRVGLIPITTYESSYGTLPSGAVLSRMRQRSIDVFASDRAEPLGVILTGNTGHHVAVATDGVSYEVRIEPSESQHYPGQTGVATASAAAFPMAQGPRWEAACEP